MRRAPADFRVSIPQVPTPPTSPAQLASDGVTSIAVGGILDDVSALFAATVNDPDPGDQLRLEIEVRPVGTAFTDTPTGSSSAVAGGAVATATTSGLTDNVSYHWQMRTVDQTGRASAWTSFGGNADPNGVDFRVAFHPTRLLITVQPGTTGAGTSIAPAVVVAAQDAGGNTLASFAGSITVAIGTNPAGGTLSRNPDARRQPRASRPSAT